MYSFVPTLSSWMAAVKSPPWTRSAEPRLVLAVTMLLAPKGMNSDTIIDTELRVMTSSSTSLTLPAATPLSCARWALERVGRPPWRRHSGM